MLNRGAIIVRPKQPFIDWAASLDDSDLLPGTDGERTVYLVPEYEDNEQLEAVLGRCYEHIFTAELEGWHLVEADWPKNRTIQMFIEWFDIEAHSLVEDLCGFELIDDTEWQD